MQPELVAATVARAMKGLIAPLVVRVGTLEEQQRQHASDPTVVDLQKLVGELRERIAALEARPPTPGPPGPTGPPGADGAAGLDGKDGAPGLRYCGVFVDGTTYRRGEIVTWAGSAWHCHADETQAKPGETAKEWQLMVKRGRDR